MLGRVFAIALVISAGSLFTGLDAAYAAGKTPPVSGMYLTTPYPALTVRGGEATTIDLALHNFDRPPESMSLSVPEIAQGWKATVLGGGQPIAAAIVGPDSKEALQLRLVPPKAAGEGDYHFLVEARGPHEDLRLPITLTIGKALPARLKLTTALPALRGSATAQFKFTVTVANDSGHDTTVDLSGDAPKGSQITFTQAYGTQQITSIPIKAGKSKDIAFTINLPHDIKAGDYHVAMRARSAAASASLPLTIAVVGRPRLMLTGEGDRLSGEAYAGEQSPLNLVLRNDGSATAHDIRLDATPPDGWKTRFEPKSLPVLLPNHRQIVKLLLTPSAQAIAGDYQMSVSANGSDDASDSQNFRITVLTSTLWGAVGIGIIAAALLVVVFAVARFGRR